MTLIAAMNIYGVPALISDLLVSAPGSDRPHIRLPTFQSVENVVPREWLRPITGTQRKCLFLNNLAVAGAGDISAIRVIFSELRKFFSLTHTSVESLSNCLCTFEQLTPQSAVILGWVVEGSKCTAFCWDSENPGNIDVGDEYCAGSGRDYFLNLLSERRMTASDNINDPVELAMGLMAGLTATLLGAEIMTGSSLQDLFGGGYEIHLFANGNFIPIQNIRVCLWKLKMDNTGVLQTDGPPILIWQSYAGNGIGIHSIWPTGYQEIGIEPGEELHIATPLGESLNVPPTKFSRDLNSQYHCNFFICDVGGDDIYMHSSVVSDVEAPPIRLSRDTEGKIKMSINPKYLQEIFADIAKEIRAHARDA